MKKPLQYVGGTSQHVAKWCEPVRLWVRASAVQRFPDNLDVEGRVPHCRITVPTTVDGHVLKGHKRVAAAANREIWCDFGSVFLRTGGSLDIAGGAGNWSIDIHSAEEVSAEPAEVWLTTYFQTVRPVAEWPKGASFFRVIDGTATFGAAAVLQGVTYPIEMAGSPAEVEVRGWWQAGTIL